MRKMDEKQTNEIKKNDPRILTLEEQIFGDVQK